MAPNSFISNVCLKARQRRAHVFLMEKMVCRSHNVHYSMEGGESPLWLHQQSTVWRKSTDFLIKCLVDAATDNSWVPRNTYQTYKAITNYPLSNMWLHVMTKQTFHVHVLKIILTNCYEQSFGIIKKKCMHIYLLW